LARFLLVGLSAVAFHAAHHGSMEMKSSSMAGIAVCVFSVAGCGAAEGGSGEQQDVFEQAEVQTEALGEAGCGTVGGYPYVGGNLGDNNGITQPAPSFPFCSFAFSSAASPTTTYGSASCPKQYILELTNTVDREMSLWPQWGGQPLNTQAACSAAKMAFGMYKRHGGTGNWTLHGTTKLHGVWMGSFCQFEHDAGYSSLVLSTRSGSPDSAVTGIRVAAFAGVGNFRVVPHRARIDILNIRETCW